MGQLVLEMNRTLQGARLVAAAFPSKLISRKYEWISCQDDEISKE